MGVIILPLIALVTIASVWTELGTVRDSELAANNDDDAAFPKRNRGFDEQRNVPLEMTTKRSLPNSAHIPDSKIAREPEKMGNWHANS